MRLHLYSSFLGLLGPRQLCLTTLFLVGYTMRRRKRNSQGCDKGLRFVQHQVSGGRIAVPTSSATAPSGPTFM